jgi:hypothetical protein
MRAGRVGWGVVMAVVGDAEIDLRRGHFVGPKKVESRVDLSQVVVRFRHRRVPRLRYVSTKTYKNQGFRTYTMKIISKDVEPVDLSPKCFKIELLQVLALSWKSDSEPPLPQSCAQLRHQASVVLLVDRRVAARFLSTRPLPVDVYAREVPLIEELSQGSNKSIAVFLRACHLGPCVCCGTCVGELPPSLC